MDGLRAGVDAPASIDEALAGDWQGAAPDGRDRRLRHRLRDVLQPGDDVEIMFVMSTAPSETAVRRQTARRLALIVTSGGAVVLARLTRLGGAELVRRFDSAAAIGTTNVAPGDCYVEVAGQRYWVHGRWTYSLYRLHSCRDATGGWRTPG